MNGWIDSRREDPIEPDLAICDAHHHLWDDPRQRYLIEEYLSDAAAHKVSSTIYVECLREYRDSGPLALRPVGETEFIHRITETSQHTGTRLAAAIVGFADLTLGAAVEEVLIAHMEASDRFRGIRYATAWDPDSRIHAAHTRPEPELLASTSFRSGYARLAKHGLVFDAWLYFHQIDELCGLAAAFPDTQIVLNHIGGPIGVGPYANRRSNVLQPWLAAIKRLSQHDNVAVKLGGMAMKSAGFEWHKQPTPPASEALAKAWTPYFSYCIELFGAARCMFESNFPVDRSSCSFGVLWNAFKRIAHSATPAERENLFHRTATRIYGISDT